jgi:hypothetical protein
VKLLATKFAKTATQGSKARRSYFTAKRDFWDGGPTTRDFLEEYCAKGRRNFTPFWRVRNRNGNSRRFLKIAKSSHGNNSVRCAHSYDGGIWR